MTSLMGKAVDQFPCGLHTVFPRSATDLILVMNQGAIIEQGSHDELLAGGGFYAELYNSQFVEASA